MPNTVFLPLDAASNCVTEKPPTTQPSLTLTLPAAGTAAGTTAAAAAAPAPAPSTNPLLESLKKMQSSTSLPPSPGEWASPPCRTGHGSVSLEAEVACPPAPGNLGELEPVWLTGPEMVLAQELLKSDGQARRKGAAALQAGVGSLVVAVKGPTWLVL